MARERILIVDDEQHIVEALQYNLEREGFRTMTACNGEQAIASVRHAAPDLILLDWMMPAMDGLEVCRILKHAEATKRIPIIMLTVKADETDKVLGLEMGVDDYITKPFGSKELVARVKALLRRAVTPLAEDEGFQLDSLRVDWGKHLVTIGGKPAPLTAKEFALLRALVQANGRVLSRAILLDRVWGYDSPETVQTRTVDFHISQLRKKLRQAGSRIVTVKQAGYRLVIDE